MTRKGYVPTPEHRANLSAAPSSWRGEVTCEDDCAACELWLRGCARQCDRWFAGICVGCPCLGSVGPAPSIPAWLRRNGS